MPITELLPPVTTKPVAVAKPMIGVTSVGEVVKTTEPEPFGATETKFFEASVNTA
jgi:hypothetical protein